MAGVLTKDSRYLASQRDGRGARRTSADERPSVAGTPRAIQTGVSGETYGAMEGWLPLASTDPALWLKELDRRW